MATLREYIKKVRSKGKKYFTLHTAVNDLQTPRKNLLEAIYRLKQKKDIVSPIRGLYIIVAPEYKFIGCIPAQELIPVIMKYLNINYYAALLTAAMYHGASHQKPIKFQVVVNKRLRDMQCGSLEINFIYKKSINKIPIEKKVVDTGYLNISSPEATAMDMIQNYQKSGGFNHIATVLSELTEAINAKKLLELVEASKQNAWIQRLGYILGKIETTEENHKNDIIKILENYLSKKELVYIPLTNANSKTKFSRNKEWKIIENTKIESDL